MVMLVLGGKEEQSRQIPEVESLSRNLAGYR